MDYKKPLKTPVLPQLILPTVYGEELSYYEGIRKLTYYINQFREYVDNIVDNLQGISNSYTDEQIDALRQEINTELDALDGKIDALRQEINTELDALDGKIDGEVNELNTALENLRTSVTNLYTNFNEYTNATNNKIELEFQNLKNYINAIANTINPIYVINPVTGQTSTIQTAINDIYRCIQSIGGLMVWEYDGMGLTAAEYDSQNLTAWEYDNLARFLLFKYRCLRMFNPFNGQLAFYDTIINHLANLHKNSYTCLEYDVLNITATNYDALNITAYNFDWNSRTSLGG